MLIKALRILQMLHAEQTVCVTTEATHIKLKKKMSKMKQTEQFNDDSRNNNQIMKRKKISVSERNGIFRCVMCTCSVWTEHWTHCMWTEMRWRNQLKQKDRIIEKKEWRKKTGKSNINIWCNTSRAIQNHFFRSHTHTQPFP